VSGICDFCSAPNPPWQEVCPEDEYKLIGVQHGREFDTGWAGHSLGDHWAACRKCHTIIAKGDAVALARRGADHLVRKRQDFRLLVAQGLLSYTDVVAMTRRSQAPFWRKRTGESRPR